MEKRDRPVFFEPEREISLIGYSSMSNESVTEGVSAFDVGDEETDRFFSEINIDFPDTALPNNDSLQCSCNVLELVRDSLDELDTKQSVECKLLCHRKKEKFWNVLFRQKVNLCTNAVTVIWAGEPGADGGGLYREFLLHSMANFDSIENLLFGCRSTQFFTALPEAIRLNQYQFLGQVSALSILKIGRGPECLHPLLVDSIFETEYSNLFCNYNDFDGELKAKLDEIKTGNNDSLLEANIVPGKVKDSNAERFAEYYCIYSRAAAINQFRKGVTSIAKCIIDNPCCFKKFFVQCCSKTTLEELRQCVSFKRSVNGTNQYEKEEDAISEVELFFMELENEQSPLKIKDFLQFCAAVDRIPLLGFSKDIEIFFVNQNIFPKVSTCGLTLTLPLTVDRSMLQFAVAEGGTFGAN